MVLYLQDVERSKKILLVISLSGVKVCSSNGEVSLLGNDEKSKKVLFVISLFDIHR